jgi:Fe2+ or Zn2+ uptake regulation protein
VEIVKVCNGLSSIKRLKIVKVLSDGDHTATEVFRKLSQHYSKVHRETIYRDLEVLLESGLVKKSYDTTTKKLTYHLATRKIIIDLNNQQVLS